MDSKLKLNEATYSTFEIEWSFDIATLPNPYTLPFELSPNVILS
jgi:hypothetical protein